MNHQCPACGSVTAAASCCGVPLGQPFVMSTERIKRLRRFVHGMKGLDEATYCLHLQAVGAQHTGDLTRDQYDALLKRLGRLPNRTRKPAQGRAA